MADPSIPIWLDAGVDDLFVGKAELSGSAFQITISDETIVELICGLHQSGRLRSLTLSVDRVDTPQTPDQLDYQKRVMGENYGT